MYVYYLSHNCERKSDRDQFTEGRIYCGSQSVTGKLRQVGADHDWQQEGGVTV